jgi:hypothetical protein
LQDHVHLTSGGYDLFSNAILEVIKTNGIAFEIKEGGFPSLSELEQSLEKGSD